MVEHPNARIARRLWEATSEGDANAIREILAPDVRWCSYDSGSLSGELEGSDAVVDLLARSGEIVDDLCSTLVDIYASERGAVLHYKVVARRGGEELEMEILLVERTEAGRIVEVFTVPRDAERNTRFWQNH
jgi:ketosteroid isomerase-like protein